MPIPDNRLAMSREERVAWLRAFPPDPLSPELRHLFLLRRMDQICPDCDRHEAAHPYCSACFLPMGVADWHDRRSRPPAPMSARYSALLAAADRREAAPSASKAGLEDQLEKDLSPG